MKVTYVESIECHRAWRKKMVCPVCNSYIYELVEQLEPKHEWYVRCPYCDAEGLPSPTKEVAIARWKQL